MVLRGHIVQCGPYGATSLYEVLLHLDYKVVPVLGQHCSKTVATGDVVYFTFRIILTSEHNLPRNKNKEHNSRFNHPIYKTWEQFWFVAMKNKN